MNVTMLNAIRSLRAYADGYAGNIRGMCATAADMLEELDKRVPRWISVEERLPEKGVFVVVYYGNFIGNLMDVYMWDGECWRSSTGYLEDAENITHWMPLPEPPKEE